MWVEVPLLFPILLKRDCSMAKIEIYTDGSSLGNPGPGGYGIVMKFKDLVKEKSEGFELTTNNRMELRAVIEAIKLLRTDEYPIEIFTDSSYVVNAVEKGWVFGWKKKGFKDKANADLWRRFLRLHAKYKIKLIWIKGHAGQKENERCDKLAKAAAQGENLKVDQGYLDIQQRKLL